MSHKIISAILVLTLATMACGFSINLPEAPTPGPEVTDQISVAAPTSGEANLQIKFGAGKLSLAPGAEGKLVEGTATYNVSDLKPEIKQDGGSVQITQGNYDFKNVVLPSQLKNDWELKLGETPMALTVEAGAYEGTMEVGSLSLKSLTIKDGAAKSEVTFSSPNASEMSLLRYETGASDVTLKGLANANFSNMIFKGGAGNYELDFSGKLAQDAAIDLSFGLSDVTLRIPKGVHAVVTVTGGLNNVSTSSGWGKNGNVYTQEGSGPILTFTVDMGAGNLTLTD